RRTAAGPAAYRAPPWAAPATRFPSIPAWAADCRRDRSPAPKRSRATGQAAGQVFSLGIGLQDGTDLDVAIGNFGILHLKQDFAAIQPGPAIRRRIPFLHMGDAHVDPAVDQI